MKGNTGLKTSTPLVHYECKSKHLKGDAHKRPLRSFSFLPVTCCLLVADREILTLPITPSHPLELVLYKDDSINRTHIRCITFII